MPHSTVDGGPVGQGDQHQVAAADRLLERRVQVDGGHRPGRGRAQDPGARLDHRPEHPSHLPDPDGTGQEHHLSKRDRARPGQAGGPLPAPHRRGRGPAEVLVDGDGPAGIEAKGDQVGLHLPHVRPVGHAEPEGPPGRPGPVPQRHRAAVQLAEGLPTGHHRTRRRQAGDHTPPDLAAAVADRPLADHRVAAVITEPARHLLALHDVGADQAGRAGRNLGGGGPGGAVRQAATGHRQPAGGQQAHGQRGGQQPGAHPTARAGLSCHGCSPAGPD
jgi:hypothetical protein